MKNNKKNSFFAFIVSITIWSVIIILFLYIPSFFTGSTQQKSINILAFPQIIDKEYMNDFEKKMGIQVNITYFESSEDLIAKLHATSEHGYDLFMISDFFVPQLIQEGFIKKIDKTRLTFLDTLYPALMNHSFDKNNEYTIPCFWSIYGIGIDLNYYKGIVPTATWSLLFDKPSENKQVGMIEDIREIVTVATYHLFKKTNNITPHHIDQVTRLLVKQKEWVAVYTDMRVEYLLVSKTCPIVLGAHSDIAKVVKRYNNLQFVVPDEGTFVKIDSYVLSSATHNEQAVYELLNYLYSPAIMKKYLDKFEFFPVTNNVDFQEVLPHYSVPTYKLFKKLHFFTPLISAQQAEKIWITVKGS